MLGELTLRIMLAGLLAAVGWSTTCMRMRLLRFTRTASVHTHHITPTRFSADVQQPPPVPPPHHGTHHQLAKPKAYDTTSDAPEKPSLPPPVRPPSTITPSQASLAECSLQMTPPQVHTPHARTPCMHAQRQPSHHTYTYARCCPLHSACVYVCVCVAS